MILNLLDSGTFFFNESLEARPMLYYYQLMTSGGATPGRAWANTLAKIPSPCSSQADFVGTRALRRLKTLHLHDLAGLHSRAKSSSLGLSLFKINFKTPIFITTRPFLYALLFKILFG